MAKENFEFKMLIGALRYYEYQETIASSMFPRDVVRKFWVNKKRTKSNIEFCKRVANQFVNTDHYFNGEDDWKDCDECYKEPWVLFYNFCKAYLNGFQIITRTQWDHDIGKINVEEKAFYVPSEDRYYLVNRYLKHPLYPISVKKSDLVKEPIQLEPEYF